MRAIILITTPGPNEREALRFVQDLDRLRVEAEIVEADSREGIAMRELYDVMATPAVVVAKDDGALVEMWQGSWPQLSEVSYNYHT